MYFLSVPGNTTSSEECQTCAPRLIVGGTNATVGYFKVMDNMELCENREPILGFMECNGFCDSRSSYSHLMRGFTNTCQCCQSTKTESRTITLTCKSGRTITKSISIPKACGCGACTSGK